MRFVDPFVKAYTMAFKCHGWLPLDVVTINSDPSVPAHSSWERKNG